MKPQCTTSADCLRELEFNGKLMKYVEEKITYSKDTGEFFWKVKANRNGANAGDKVGHIDGKGYLRTRILGKNFRLHRLAWLINYGEFPVYQIDHINRIKTDNRIQNLRDVRQKLMPQIRKTKQANFIFITQRAEQIPYL